VENLDGIGTEVPAMPCRLRVYGSVEVLVVRGSGVLGFGRVRMCGRTLSHQLRLSLFSVIATQNLPVLSIVRSRFD